MRSLRWDEQRFAPEVRKTGGEFQVTVAGETFRFALVEEAPGVFTLRNAQRSVRFHLARQGGAVHLFWEGSAYELTEEPEGSRSARRHDAGALEAPMPGRVVAVRAEAGQRVKKGDELLVVEAMKMENALRAPLDGVVRAVHVAVGDPVAPGRPLVEFEAEA